MIDEEIDFLKILVKVINKQKNEFKGIHSLGCFFLKQLTPQLKQICSGYIHDDSLINREHLDILLDIGMAHRIEFHSMANEIGIELIKRVKYLE